MQEYLDGQLIYFQCFLKDQRIRPFPKSLEPQFENESMCENNLIKMTMTSMKVKLHAELHNPGGSAVFASAASLSRGQRSQPLRHPSSSI